MSEDFFSRIDYLQRKDVPENTIVAGNPAKFVKAISHE